MAEVRNPKSLSQAHLGLNSFQNDGRLVVLLGAHPVDIIVIPNQKVACTG